MPRQGYKSITVTNETYAQIAYCALQKNKSIPELLDSITKDGEFPNGE